MHTIRECIKTVIKTVLLELNESQLKEDALYQKFVHQHGLQKKVLDRLLIPIKKPSGKKKLLKNIIEPTVLDMKVLVAISEVFKLPITAILSESRIREFVDARRVFSAFLTIYLDYNLKDVGGRLSRDHASIINHQITHENLLKTNKDYRRKNAALLEILYRTCAEEIEGIASLLEYKNEKAITKNLWNALCEFQPPKL